MLDKVRNPEDWFSGDVAHMIHIIDLYPQIREIWARGYKTYFMLNSAETKIYPANKC